MRPDRRAYENLAHYESTRHRRPNALRRAVDFSGLTRVFSNKDFSLYTAGNSVALIAYWMQRLAVGWLAWQLTKSGFWLGLVAFAELFPALVLAPFAGVLTDRFDHRRIIVRSQTILLLQAMTLALLTSLDLISIEILLALTLVSGTSVALQDPARLAIVSRLVGTAHLAAAVAVGTSIFNTARFLGAMLAGLVIIELGVAAAILGHALGAATLILCLRHVQLSQRSTGGERTGTLLSELQSGFRYAFSHHAIGLFLLLFLSTTLFLRPVYELMPGIADTILHRGPGGLAMLTSAAGLGAVTAGIYLTQHSLTKKLLRLALLSSTCAAVILILLALNSSFFLALAMVFLLGLTMAICSTSAQIFIQLSVQDNMRGRVLSLWAAIIRGGPAVGAPVLGWLSGFNGFRWPLLVGGSLCLFVLIAVFRRLRKISSFPDPSIEDTV